MFETLTFHALFKLAIGKVNHHDKIVTPATYYNFRKRVVEHKAKTGEDLLEACFQQITREQVLHFNVNGTQLRMDSKLFGSNIANNTRYDIIAITLQNFLKLLNNQNRKRLNKIERNLAKEITKEDVSQTVYVNTSEYIKTRLISIGGLIHKILTCFKDFESVNEFSVLKRVFDEQYVIEYTNNDDNNDHQDNTEKPIEHDTISITLNKDVPTQSVQSPYDTECTYRNKNNKPVRGYAVNATETVSDSKEDISLITDVQVENASIADKHFLLPAIQRSKKVTNQTPKKLYADGAFSGEHDPEQVENIDLVFSGMQGRPGRYKLEQTEKGILVTDTQTNIVYTARPVKKHKGKKSQQCSIVNQEGKRVYFSEDAVRAAELREKLQNRSREELNKRNNVEATIFMLGYHLRNGKSKYRGLQKQKMWVYCRALWINLLRIKKYIGGLPPEVAKQLQNSFLLLKYRLFLSIQAILGLKNQMSYIS